MSAMKAESLQVLNFVFVSGTCSQKEVCAALPHVADVSVIMGNQKKGGYLTCWRELDQTMQYQVTDRGKIKLREEKMAESLKGPKGDMPSRRQALSTQPYKPTPWTPARPGADDHQDYKSLRTV